MKATGVNSLMFILCLLSLGDVLAQKALPNPLVQPPKRAAPSGAPEGAPSEGGAPSGQPPQGKEAVKEVDSGLGEVLGKVSGLYVSAIIGDVAVLRASAGSGGSASSGQASGGAGGGASGAAAGGGAGGASNRAVVYFVRDAEPFQIFDRYRLLPKIQDTTVLLYLMPDNPQDAGKRPQIVFRSTLDSVGSTPYIPPKMEAPGSVDGYQGLISTGAGGSSGGKAPGGAGGSGAAK